MGGEELKWYQLKHNQLVSPQGPQFSAHSTAKFLDITFGLHVVDSSLLVSILFREAFSHSYISFFHLLVNGFLLLVSVLFRRPLTFFIVVGGIGERGDIKMASSNTQSTNEPARSLNLVHTVKLKPTIKAHISGKMAFIGISDVVTASVYLEKTRLKKLMMIMIMNKSQETTVCHGC